MAVLVVLAFAIAPAVAQPSLIALAGDLDQVSTASIDAALARVNAELAREDISEADRETALRIQENYQRARQALDRAALFRASGAEHATAASEAPVRLAAIREELARAPETPTAEPAPDATVQQLEQQLAQATRDLEAARKDTATLSAEASRRDQRRGEIQDRTTEVRRAREAINDALGAPRADSDPLSFVAARRVSQLAERMAYDDELKALASEAASYDARRDLLPARQDRALRRVQQGEALVGEWQRVVNAKREQDASQAAREALRLRREAARQHPALREFAAQSELLASQGAGDQGLPAKISRTAQLSLEDRARLAAISGARRETEDRVLDSGLNRATGLLLRQQFEGLPEAGELRRQIDETNRELIANEYAMLELRDARRGAGDIDRVVRELLDQAVLNDAEAGSAEIEAVARELAVARRDLLDALIANRDTYHDSLTGMHDTLIALREQTTAYRSFIEEHILWVRSVPGDPLPSSDDIKSAGAWALDTQAWRAELTPALTRLRERWASALWRTAAVLLLLACGAIARRRLRDITKNVGGYRTDSYLLTIRAVFLTAIISAGGPAVLWLLAWTVRAPEIEGVRAMAVGDGLVLAAIVWIPLALLRHTLRPSGLGVSHFRWRPQLTREIRVRLRWFTPIAVLCTFALGVLAQSESEEAYAVIGRAVFTLGMLAMAAFIAGVLRPGGRAMAPILARNGDGWVWRLRYVWYAAATVLPLALAGLAWAGYFYTSLRLEARLENTLVLVLALIGVNALLARWLFIERRRVAVEEARRRRAQAASTDPAAGKGEGAPIDTERLDLPGISTQTRQLFRAGIVITAVLGLLLIWADVTPALRMLDRVQVYPTPVYLDAGARETPEDAAAVHTPTPAPSTNGNDATAGSGTLQGAFTDAAAAGQQATETEGAGTPGEQEPISVTLADLGAALLVLVVTWVVFRNLPGLVEIVLLQRLPLDAGSRYALSTVLRYAIAILGVAAAFNAIEIPWSKVQWLAAALTFGLAFGLQEIFANFVSGLIILAERPFRVGDTVTVNSITGSVSRIRMRATTVTDWDLKELVIPNKTFITGEVVNWTLTDTTLRVTIPVGVSYSSDTEKVERVLREIARTHPTVLEEPKPQVLFRGFGDSTLDFELRVYIPNIESLVPTRHAMHQQIFKTFRAEGIEIAFPQRDLHIRSADPLAEMLRRDGAQHVSPDAPPGERDTGAPPENRV